MGGCWAPGVKSPGGRFLRGFFVVRVSRRNSAVRCYGERELGCPAMPQKQMLHRTELLVGPDALKRLSTTKVILFGVGGVGSWCADVLARSGVGHLTLVDSDRVCVTNVNRQAQATSLNVGRVKVLELESRLREISPHADIRALHKAYEPETRDEFALESFDYVIDAIDSLSNKVDLIKTALAKGRPIFSAMGAASKLDPTRIREASIWKTQGCPLARKVRQRLRQSGVEGDFVCVFSDEVLPNHDIPSACGTRSCMCPKPLPAESSAPDWCAKKAQVNGSIAHMTAAFGMHLAGLVIRDIYCGTRSQERSEPSLETA